jgi:hypothetical protein
MNIGRQSLVMRDFAAQPCERVALVACKRSAEIRFVRDDDFRKFCQCALALFRKNELGMSPVFRTSSPLHQTLVRKFVD